MVIINRQEDLREIKPWVYNSSREELSKLGQNNKILENVMGNYCMENNKMYKNKNYSLPCFTIFTGILWKIFEIH